jgi:hypothetical protein
VLGGAALVALPLIAQQYAWISAGFAKHGVHGAPVALFGSVLFGLWIVTRSRGAADLDDAEQSARESEKSESESDQALLLEQIASDLAIARGGMQELRVEFVYLKDAVQNVQQEGVDPTTGINEAQAAIFRLAASMDQLGGRLDQRLRAQDSAVHEVMNLLRSELSQTATSLMDLRLSIEQGIASASGPVLTPERYIADGHEDQVDFSEVDETGIEPGYRPSPDDLEVEVELEEDRADGLGLLDELDDLGTPRKDKTSPSIRPSIPRTNTYADLGIEDSDGAAEELLVKGALPVQNGAHDDEVDQKLELLRELMADPDVRRALEEARHRA